MAVTAIDTPEEPHAARITTGGFVICCCGWSTAEDCQRDTDPRRIASGHIEQTAPPDASPCWQERPGGTVCVADV